MRRRKTFRFGAIELAIEKDSRFLIKYFNQLNEMRKQK